ncbi:hypothetical protein ABT297_23660 [Dactylosporangium sp. NPDC000555]|uniref:hypothetical protein n=1 Tax=Dactylosporangium sp. NPDC000555 TaxID=3154260 RepID=UPI003317E0AC
MSDTRTTTTGGFAGDPAAALAVAGTSGCCGSPPTATLNLPEPAAAGTPCCGTTAEASAEPSCCGSAAKADADADAAGQGCCG